MASPSLRYDAQLTEFSRSACGSRMDGDPFPAPSPGRPLAAHPSDFRQHLLTVQLNSAHNLGVDPATELEHAQDQVATQVNIWLELLHAFGWAATDGPLVVDEIVVS